MIDEKLFVINSLIFTASRTVPNDHLRLISQIELSRAHFKEHLGCAAINLWMSPTPAKISIVLYLARVPETKEGKFPIIPPFPHLENELPVHWNSRSESFCIRPAQPLSKGTKLCSRWPWPHFVWISTIEIVNCIWGNIWAHKFCFFCLFTILTGLNRKWN